MNLKTTWIAATLLLGSVPAFARPTVSEDQAKQIALGRIPGKVMHEKLKKAEKAGKNDSKKKAALAHDHYNIKILPTAANKGLWKRVEVDATTGAILDVKNVKPKSYDD